MGSEPYMAMDVPWAIKELEDFIARAHVHSDSYARGGPDAYRHPAIKAMHDRVMEVIPVVERIADRGWPEWRQHLPGRSTGDWEYDPHVQMAKQLLVLLAREKELEEKLGETGPALSVSTMHPNVWEASKSLWRSGHYGEAVSAAAKSVNAALQTKVSRRDQSDAKLVGDCFSLNPPQPGVPRLRLMKDDGSDAYKSVHEGAAFFGRGCFMGIRNVLAHEYGPQADPPEEVALHYLAAFSTLARWIDQATVER
jgi:uncharacterized protein (TIGR02391 family)